MCTYTYTRIGGFDEQKCPKMSGSTDHHRSVNRTYITITFYSLQPRIDAVWLGGCSGQTAPGRDVTRGRGYSLPAPDRCRLARPVFRTNSPGEGRHPWPLVIKRWFSLPSSPPVITLFLRVMIARGPLYVPATSAVFCTNTSNGCSSSFRIDLGLVCIGYLCGPIISVSMETILYLNNIDTAKFNNSTVRSHFRSRTGLKRILKSDVTWGNFSPATRAEELIYKWPLKGDQSN